MPNPKYKSEFYLITKKRKKIIQNQDEELELKLPSEQNNKCYITKERKFIVQKGTIIPVKKINYIKKERKRIIKEEKIKLPLKDLYYVEKINKKGNLNEIKTIQNIFRTQKHKKKKDEDILFNNKDKNAFIIRKKFIEENNDNEHNNKNNYIFEGYISKINKKYIYKLYPPEKCYISKESKFQIKNQPNINNEPKEKNFSFLSLLEFFIKKNIDEYVFPKLKINEINEEINNNKPLETNYRIDTNQNVIEENNSETFTYPKYYKMLRRIFNFYKTQKREDKPEAKKIYDRLIPSMKDSKSLNDLINKLNDNPEETLKIIESLPNSDINNDELIEEIGEFVKYEKNLSNSAFIKNKLKENPNMKQNTTLFNMIKNVDDEYNNLINGKYCYKCGKEILKCKCDDINYIFKETENGEESEKNKEIEGDDDDNFDFGMDDDDDEGITKTKKINYFEYDTNKKKGLKMINKPRLEDYITQPKKVLQICNRNQLNEINNNLRNIRLDSKNSNLKLSNNEFNSENNAHQRNVTNSNFINTYNSNNDDVILTSNNKNVLSSYNFK